MEVLVAYIFSEGKLVKGKYLFHSIDNYKNNYIADYKKVKETLTLKYDLPKSDEEIWSDELYKKEPKEWRIALSSGHLAYKTSWETETTVINLVLHGDEGQIIFGVVYSNKKLGHPEEVMKGESRR